MSEGEAERRTISQRCASIAQAAESYLRHRQAAIDAIQKAIKVDAGLTSSSSQAR